MTQAKTGDTVKIHYSGKLDDGTEFDSSAGRDTLEFKIGEGTIIPTLEESVVGMAVGDANTVNIAAVDAYGPRQDEAIQTVERSMIPDTVELTIGGQVTPEGEEGAVLCKQVCCYVGEHPEDLFQFGLDLSGDEAITIRSIHA